ncbi:MAG TPA: ATP-binding protein, partial [Gammaproteobacteria bacterium]|nr:ATP-binding protein [Gammaproteobacteria bacterium]
MRSRMRSVRTKLLAGVLLTTLAALLVSGAALLAFDLHTVRASLRDDLSTQAELIGRACVPALQFDDPKVANGNLALLEARPTIDAAALYDSKGAIFASYARKGSASVSFPPLPDEDAVTFDGEDIVVNRRIVADNEIVGSIYLHAHYEFYQRIRNYIGILLAVGALATLVSLLLSTWMQATITRPILAITRLAQQVTEKRDYSPRAEKTTEDEIGYLVDSFNEMLNEIGERAKAVEASNRELTREVAERKNAEDEVLRLNKELEARVEERTRKLQEINNELEAFSYSVSHDLRAPLRAVDGFSQALMTEYGEQSDDRMRHYLQRIQNGAARMSQLIEDLLNLSRISRLQMQVREVDLSALAQHIVQDLQQRDPEREVSVSIWDNISVMADQRLLRVALENLLGNAWKFTGKTEQARIEFGMLQEGEKRIIFVRDNGAGFDMAYADKLFGAFQRLHGMHEFPGTGIGLATVQRIVNRHGGRIWCQAAPGKGATFFFTLQAELQAA